VIILIAPDTVNVSKPKGFSTADAMKVTMTQVMSVFLKQPPSVSTILTVTINAGSFLVNVSVQSASVCRHYFLS